MDTTNIGKPNNRYRLFSLCKGIISYEDMRYPEFKYNEIQINVAIRINEIFVYDIRFLHEYSYTM